MAIDCKFVKLFNDNIETDEIFNSEELNIAFDNGYIFEGEMIDISLTSSRTFGRNGTYVKLVKYEDDKCECKFTFDFGSPVRNSRLYENIIPDKKEYKYVDIKLFHTSVASCPIVVKKYSNDVNNYKIS